MPKISNNSQVNETSQRRWDLAMEAARKQFSVIPELKVVGPNGVPKPTEAEIEKLAIEIAAMMGIRDPRPFLRHADTAAQVIPMRPRDPKASGLSGLRTDAGNAAVGAGVGALGPADSPEERLRNMAGGALLLGAGGRLSRTVGARNALADTATAGMGKPRTPQQAARFETPGSPEYEAAIAKGLDMSTPARMARAKEMGFDTGKPVYRGLTRPYDAEKAGRYQMFTSSAADAGEFAGNGSVQGGNVVAAYLRRGKNLSINGGGNNFNSVPVSQLPAEVRRNLHPSIGATARTDEIAEAAQKAGFDSVSIKNVFDNSQGEIPRKPRPAAKDDVDALLAELEAGGFDMSAKGSMQIVPEIPRNYDPVTVDVIFDPSNIRSVNAAFDPDKAASPILTAGIGGGGRGPRKPTVGKPKSDIGTKVADATAIAALTIAPPADGQSGDGAELQAANERVKAATQRVADVDKSIAQLEADKRLLENPASDPSKVQDLLDRRGFDLGPKGLDGRIGPDTRKAIADNIAKIEGEIARKGGERENAEAEVEKARKGVTQAEMLQIQRERETGPITQFLRDNGATIGVAAGLIGGYASRRGAVKKAALTATKAAQQADALVNTNPVNRRSKKGADGIDTRVPNLNKFWDEGGAGENVPFEAMKKGGWKPKPRAASPQSLYRPPDQRTPSGFVRSRVGTMDIGMMAAGVAEAKTMEGLKANEQKKMDKAQADVDRYFKEGNVAAYNDALARLQTSRNLYATYYFFERAGYGFAGARALATLKSPYTHVRPNIAAAEKELKLLRDDIAKP